MKGIAYFDRNEGAVDRHGNMKPPNWAYRFEGAAIGGKRKFIQKSGFATKRDAMVAGSKAFAEYSTSGSVFEPSSMSYADCLDSWLKNYVDIRCVQTTQEGYRKILKRHIIPNLGKYSLASIKHETIQNFMNSLYHKRLSRNTLQNILGIISNSLRYARKQDWIETNPALDIDLPTSRMCANNHKKERVPVPRDIITKIFERFPEGHPAHLPFMLAYHCGMRLGEVFGLEWKDVDLDERVIRIKQQVLWSPEDHEYRITPPKYDSIREIKFDSVLAELLRREKQRQDYGRLGAGSNYHQLYIDANGRLNTYKDGKPINMVNTRPDGTYVQERATQHYSHVIKTELGYKDFDFHSLRHTHATELCEAGVNLKEIQRRLGHSTMEVTSKRYLHATQAMEDESVVKMETMFAVAN